MNVIFQMPSFVTILDFVGTFAFAISGIRLLRRNGLTGLALMW